MELVLAIRNRVVRVVGPSMLVELDKSERKLLGRQIDSPNTRLTNIAFRFSLKADFIPERTMGGNSVQVSLV